MVETDGGDEGSDRVGHHMGLDNHLDHPDMGQQTDLIYHPGMGEVEADYKDSYHPNEDDFEKPIDLG